MPRKVYFFHLQAAAGSIMGGGFPSRPFVNAAASCLLLCYQPVDQGLSAPAEEHLRLVSLPGLSLGDSMRSLPFGPCSVLQEEAEGQQKENSSPNISPLFALQQRTGNYPCCLGKLLSSFSALERSSSLYHRSGI